MSTRTYIAPLVGMHFRPPAKALVGVLPVGTSLQLVPEPENPYDVNAVRVEVSGEVLREICENTAARSNLEMQLEGFGESIESVLSAEVWHLGYVESSKTKSAERFAKVLAGEARECTFGLDAAGKPRVVLEAQSTEE